MKDKLYKQLLSDFDLSNRVINQLNKKGIYTFQDLVKEQQESDFPFAFSRIGIHALKEIRYLLREYGVLPAEASRNKNAVK